MYLFKAYTATNDLSTCQHWRCTNASSNPASITTTPSKEFLDCRHPSEQFGGRSCCPAARAGATRRPLRQSVLWRDRTREVDFVVDVGGRLDLVEVKWTELRSVGDTTSLRACSNNRPVRPPGRRSPDEATYIRPGTFPFEAKRDHIRSPNLRSHGHWKV